MCELIECSGSFRRASDRGRDEKSGLFWYVCSFCGALSLGRPARERCGRLVHRVCRKPSGQCVCKAPEENEPGRMSRPGIGENRLPFRSHMW